MGHVIVHLLQRPISIVSACNVVHEENQQGLLATLKLCHFCTIILILQKLSFPYYRSHAISLEGIQWKWKRNGSEAATSASPPPLKICAAPPDGNLAILMHPTRSPEKNKSQPAWFPSSKVVFCLSCTNWTLLGKKGSIVINLKSSSITAQNHFEQGIFTLLILLLCNTIHDTDD